MTEAKKVQPVLLCIMDGWGMNDSDYYNAIKNGNTPFFDRIDREHPPIGINASGEDVGLPEGQMGNSEVGHLNIGAGRVVMQDLPKINTAVKDGGFYQNPVIKEGMAKARDNGGDYHLLGLVSDGGVHSHMDHIIAFLKMAKKEGLKQVYLHALMDGRDTPPHAGADYMAHLTKEMEAVGIGKVATVAGRYWTMDRDNRWDRVEKGYRALVKGEGEYTAADPVQAIKESYGREETDEFIKPTVITDGDGPAATLKKGDVLQVFNFRADRVRQIVHALTDTDFDRFERGAAPGLSVYCMTEYAADFDFPVAFEDKPPQMGIGETLAGLGLKQFRTAETEKYAHVTYFMNGGREEPFQGEERKLIPSPGVSTYDLKPEMSAYEVADAVTAALQADACHLLVVNFANGDMVGHTGVYEAALKAVETVDICVGRVTDLALKKGWKVLLTADHGNIEVMRNSDNKPVTSHSTNLVPLYLLGADGTELDDRGGALCDIAPTILKLMGVAQPDEMTGRPLIK